MLNSFLHALLFCSSARSGAQRLVFCSRFTTGICLRCCPVFFYPLSFPDWDLLALLPSVLSIRFFFFGLGFACAAAQCFFMCLQFSRAVMKLERL